MIDRDGSINHRGVVSNGCYFMRDAKIHNFYRSLVLRNYALKSDILQA